MTIRHILAGAAAVAAVTVGAACHPPAPLPDIELGPCVVGSGPQCNGPEWVGKDTGGK